MTITPTERRELALSLGVHEQYLYQCLSGIKAMKPQEAVRVERESGGKLTRRDLRPKDWHLVWPELVTEEFPAPASDAPVEAA